MDILQAHEFLANLPEAERFDLLPLEALLEADGQDGVDCWPGAAVAGLIVIGWLANVESDADLREGLRHLSYLAGDGLIDLDEWQDECLRVVDELLRWGDALPRFHAAHVSRN